VGLGKIMGLKAGIFFSIISVVMIILLVWQVMNYQEEVKQHDLEVQNKIARGCHIDYHDDKAKETVWLCPVK
jgi:mRNA-degrading endonuclease YafQ of YafQ-DinJ toxin-antitoxin module